MPLLNTADAVYLGDTPATRAYLGSNLIFEATPATITNLLTNPSAETNTTNWAVFAGGGGTAAVSRPTSGGVSGTGFVRATWSVGTSGIGSGPYTGAAVILPVTEGVTYAASGSVRCSKAQRIVAKLEWYTSGGGSISQTSVAVQVVSANTWTRLSGSGTAPATAARARVSFFSDPGTGGLAWVAGDTLDVDAAMLTEGSTVWAYRDGSFAAEGWSWTGVAHASTSSGPAPA